jgi:hypothetical protein
MITTNGYGYSDPYLDILLSNFTACFTGGVCIILFL